MFLKIYQLIFIGEAFFVLLIVLAVYFPYLRRRKIKAEIKAKRLQTELNIVNEQLTEARHRLNGPTPTVATANEKSQQMELDFLRGELDLERQSNKNLQQFKRLYFEIADNLDQHQSGAVDEENISHYRETIKTQERLLADLREKLASEKNRRDVNDAYIQQMEINLEELEVTSKKFSAELALKEQQLKQAEIYAAQLEKVKSEAQRITRDSERTQAEIINYKRMVQELKNKLGTMEQSGEEIVLLTEKLQEKDREINSLKTECDTLAMQYQQLAMQSLSANKDVIDSGLSAEVEQLRKDLHATAIELDTKRRLCEKMEADYLKLERNQAADAFAELCQNQTDQERLHKHYDQLSRRVEELVGVDAREKLGELRQRFSEGMKKLSGSQENYQALSENLMKTKEVVIETDKEAQASHKSTEEVIALRNENTRLKTVESELFKLRTEHTALEARYLALLSKSN